MQRWQCPINNGTLKSFVQFKHELEVNLVCNFQNCGCAFLLQKALKELSELITLNLEKRNYSDKGTVVNRVLSSQRGESLTFTLTVPLVLSFYHILNCPRYIKVRGDGYMKKVKADKVKQIKQMKMLLNFHPTSDRIIYIFTIKYIQNCYIYSLLCFRDKEISNEITRNVLQKN